MNIFHVCNKREKEKISQKRAGPSISQTALTLVPSVVSVSPAPHNCGGQATAFPLFAGLLNFTALFIPLCISLVPTGKLLLRKMPFTETVIIKEKPQTSILCEGK